MKKYRVWAYETIGHYIDIKAQNKADAYNKAMDVHVLDWTQSGGDEIGDLNIKKKDIEEIKDNNTVGYEHIIKSYSFPFLKK